MRCFRILALLSVVMAVSSCMAMDMLPDMYEKVENPLPYHYISGRVFDRNDNPIEHIKVTLEWGGGLPETIKYTASDGGFEAEIPHEAYKDGRTITLTMEDIDGEENRGLFETLTDNIIVSADPENHTGILIYRLNPATASESSPQS